VAGAVVGDGERQIAALAGRTGEDEQSGHGASMRRTGK
jgi:hypothetical protein